VGRRRSGGGAAGWLRWLEIRQQLVDEDNGGLGEDGSGGCRGRRRRRLQGKGKAASRGCGRGELGLGCVGGGGVREWRLGGGEAGAAPFYTRAWWGLFFSNNSGPIYTRNL
jgi:hypothetical protein